MARAKTIDAAEQQIGQDRPRDMPSTGPARIEDPLIEPVAGPNWQEKAAELAFMEEPVDVLVHESTDPRAEPIIQVGVNGRNQFFLRGQVQTVRRKFIERLARAKRTSYSQQNYKDADGNDAIRNIPRTALEYPFSIVRDQNPRGADWLKKVLAEA